MANSPQSNTRFNGLEVVDNILYPIAPVTYATAGVVTYTAAEFTSGLILRDCAGAGRSDVSPTAAALYTELGSPLVGSSFNLIVRNTTGAAFSITMTGGTGVTVSGTATIAQSNTKLFVGVFTSPTAVTLYSIGTFVH
jgi:hypothetical protein